MARKRNADIERERIEKFQAYLLTEEGADKRGSIQLQYEIERKTEKANQKSILKATRIADAFTDGKTPLSEIMDLIGDGLTPGETYFFYCFLSYRWSQKNQRAAKAKPSEAKRQQIYNDYLDAWYRKPYQQAKAVTDQIAHHHSVSHGYVSRIVSAERIKRELPPLDAKRLVPR